ncbi:MAG: hypothetical protein ABSH52_26625, partial [Terriglobia bacterium]
MERASRPQSRGHSFAPLRTGSARARERDAPATAGGTPAPQRWARPMASQDGSLNARRLLHMTSSRPLKIAHIDLGESLRGGQRQLLNLARRLRERGYCQIVV